MSLKLENNDDDSFIILGTSPGTSLDLKCGDENGSVQNGDVNPNGDVLDGDVKIDKVQMEEALKDLSNEANMAFKAHFKLGDCPSPASMMVASTIITDDRSTVELQKRFGELLDENVILKETLKQNNDSMKEQFLLIASCQEDMLRTHMMHKEKFDETKELVERLHKDRKASRTQVPPYLIISADTLSIPTAFPFFRLLIDHSISSKVISDADSSESVTDSVVVPASGISSYISLKYSLHRANTSCGLARTSPALDFILSILEADEQPRDFLTSLQKSLVFASKFSVIVDNEKLTWQKESLEHIVDATSKERDDLKEKLKLVELQLSIKESEHITEINNLKYNIQDLNSKLQKVNACNNISIDEVHKREVVIEQLEAKISTLQGELRNAQLKILELENVKLEFTRHRSSVNETVKLYRDQIQDLQNRLKEASTTVFQPVRFSLSSESDASSTEYTSYVNNVKLYDRTLKHLAELLNKLTHGLSDSLVQTLGVVASLYDYKLEKTSVEQFKAGLAEVKQQLEKQHADSLNNIGQLRGTMTIFEGIFKDHSELLKKIVTKQEPRQQSLVNVEALTGALVARGQELQLMEAELNRLKADKEDREVLKAQLELYKSDFEAERESREKMACEKETILTDLRQTQRRNQELTTQLEELRNQKPSSHRPSTQLKTAAPARQTSAPARHSNATGNVIYTCPKCMRFNCDDYKMLDDHFDFCLDDF
ncbi:hypothetical protein K1T71_010084 [Dendrolimus kikuchii]|uniref:Uncharacterized protein n=1 Tax=Dendrolimus kikuchii TaxID=765133 RepID=A0ACC1CQY6_9NEOP|nr:hypothetical protein K1T71_010084 [Dendrolimus kikuchii]